MDLTEKSQEGHVAVFPLEAVTALHNLWLSLTAVIPHIGRWLRLIFDFTWSSLNDVSKRLAPTEAMRFGGALQRILEHELTANLSLSPVYLNKVDSADAYMRMWVRMEDFLSVAFLISKKTLRNMQLVGLHLYLPMGYVDRAPYFCLTTEMVEDVTKKAITHQDTEIAHPI